MKRLSFVMVLLVIFFLNFIPVKDSDFGWHYQCGQELLKGNPCVSNNYSYFLPNYQAYYPSFIFDGVTALVFNTTGFMGLSILHALAITLVFWVIMKRFPDHVWFTLLGFFLTLFLSWNVIGIGWRPQVLTYLLVVCMYFLIEKALSGRYRLLYIVPPIMLFWVNMHIGFFTGIVLLGGATADRFLQFVLKKDQKNLNQFGFLCGISLTSILATFINPFGYKVYIELIRHAQSPLNTMIAEWVAPQPFHIIIISVLTLAILIIATMQKKLSTYQILILLFFTVTTLMARRNLPLFYTIAFIQLRSFVQLGKIQINDAFQSLFVPLGAALVIGLAVIQIKSTTAFHSSWETYCSKGQSNYPCQALKEYPQLKGNVYTMYEYGGFMIWQRPDINVFADGRMPAWSDENGESPYSVYLKILQTQPGWNEQLKKYNTDYLLLTPGTFLSILLEEKAATLGWKKEYENPHHLIYKRAK